MDRSNISSTSRHSLRRRQFLGGLTVATLPLLAGCTGQTEGSFDGTPVGISDADLDALGFEEVARDDRTEDIEGSAYGIGVSATVTSHYSVYSEIETDPGLTVSALSTPKARVLFGQRNPLVNVSGQRLLYNDDLLWFREPAGLGEIDRQWERNSTRLLSERVDVLGDDVRITSRGGYFEGDQPSVMFVHYGKVETEDDAVFLYAVRQWDVDAEDTDQPLVGEDGMLSEDEFAADLVAARTALSAFQFE